MFILTAEKRDKMKKEFICPHCKEAAGWCEITPIRGHYVVYYGASGQFDIADYSDGMTYYDKSTRYECVRCGRSVKGAVLRYKKEQGND